MHTFSQHQGYTRAFQENKLTLGFVFPLEGYEQSEPVMDIDEQVKLAQLVEETGFASLFVRDVPLNDPYRFGDAAQMYDPWVYLSHIAAQTDRVALGTSSAITSFVHPVILAKSAASLDKLSSERLLFGLATGDRPVEFEAFGVDREKRTEYYRETFQVARDVWGKSYPTIDTERVKLDGAIDILPKPTLGDIPTFVTGFSGQSLDWIAEHSDGWLQYPRGLDETSRIIHDFRSKTDGFKPYMHSLYIDLLEDPHAEPSQIHLGFRTGSRFLVQFLKGLEAAGVNHVVLVLKFATRPIDEVIQDLGEQVLPHFPSHG